MLPASLKRGHRRSQIEGCVSLRPELVLDQWERESRPKADGAVLPNLGHMVASSRDAEKYSTKEVLAKRWSSSSIRKRKIVPDLNTAVKWLSPNDLTGLRIMFSAGCL